MELTRDGDAVLDDFAPRLHDLLRAVIHEVLSAEEIAGLIDSLERIQQACDDLATDQIQESGNA